MTDLLEQLVAIESITGREMALCRFLYQRLESEGYRVQRQQVSCNRFNLLALTPEPPVVLLCTHMDTVGPFLPFRRSGDRLYGRVVCDAKGALFCMIEAGRRLIGAGEKNL
ncbi:hypothetical protein JW992_00215 [candidate division KSB1 bacterium]|nr:hypothetical protein [candidate division KSB1 bacterium]